MGKGDEPGCSPILPHVGKPLGRILTLVGCSCSKMFSRRVAPALLAFLSCLYICVVGGTDGARPALRYVPLPKARMAFSLQERRKKHDQGHVPKGSVTPRGPGFLLTQSSAQVVPELGLSSQVGRFDIYAQIRQGPSLPLMSQPSG